MNEETVVDFYGRRNYLKDITHIQNGDELAAALFISICYLADLHENKRLFHGDIKPANLFVSTDICFGTSDSGSLVPLTGSDKYFADVFTPGFASALHMKRV